MSGRLSVDDPHEAAYSAAHTARVHAEKRQDHMMVVHLHQEHGYTVRQIQSRMKHYGVAISQSTIQKLVNAASDARRS